MLDIAGLDRSSQMSTAEGLSTPLIDIPPSPIQSSTVDTPVLEDSDHITQTPHSIDPDRYVLTTINTCYLEASGQALSYHFYVSTTPSSIVDFF